MFCFIETLQTSDTATDENCIYLSDSDDLPESIVSSNFCRSSGTEPTSSASASVRQVASYIVLMLVPIIAT